jgi:hypothetical protein
MTRKEQAEPAEKRERFLPRTRCTAGELAAVQERAAAAGLTESAYLRQIATTGRVIVRQSKADAALVSQLQRIGTNINQMARAMHQTGGAVPPALPATLDVLETLLDKLMEEAR